MKKKLNFDVVIIGGGPGGFSSAIYATRGALKTAIIDKTMMGGQPSNYLEIENYPGFCSIGGYELMEKMEEHADKFGVDKYSMQEINSVDLKSKIKVIETNDYLFFSKAVIIATGATSKKLGIKGESEFLGRGVSYCAVCDGAFYKDKIVTVVGGGNSAIEEAIYLTKFASKVYIIHRRDTLRASKLIQNRAFANKKIEFIYDSQPIEIIGDKLVNSLVIKNLKTNETTVLNTDGVFPYIGFSPNVNLFTSVLKCDQNKFIITDQNMKTSIDGVYAVGDVRNTPLRQVITAASDGAIAANEVVRYIEEQLESEKEVLI